MLDIHLLVLQVSAWDLFGILRYGTVREQVYSTHWSKRVYTLQDFLRGTRSSTHFITRNEVTFLYVLLECFKWISTYFKANNAINPYNIDLL